MVTICILRGGSAKPLRRRAVSNGFIASDSPSLSLADFVRRVWHALAAVGTTGTQGIRKKEEKCDLMHR